MKKTLLSVASSVAFAAVVALVGCSAPTTVNYDTIESIGAPKVTAKTYAGVVRLTWNVVKGAEKYEIYKDGVLVANYNGTDCVYEDIATTSNNLVDGVKYTYDVVALPKGNYAMKQQDRAVYIKENQTTVTVEAKVPSPEDFKAEYESYFAKFDAEETEFKTELVTGEGWSNYIMVTAPTLPEFKYEIKTYVEVPSPLGDFGVIDTKTVSAFTFTENDAAKLYAAPNLQAGDIKASVRVIPLSRLYQDTEFTDDLHVPALEITKGTADLTAWHVDSTTVRLQWYPAHLNGVYYDPADYKIFVCVDGVYTMVNGDIKVLNAGDSYKDVSGKDCVVEKTTYYIDDTVANGDATKTYYATLNKEYSYEAWNDDVPKVWLGAYREPALTGKTDNRKAWYVDSTTVYLEWTPASLNGVYCNPADYSVYGELNGVYTKVEGEVKVWNPGEVNGTEVITQTTYYIEDTVAEGEARKTYYTALYKENGNKWDDKWDDYGKPLTFVWQDDSSDWDQVYDGNASIFNDGKKVRISFTPVATTDSASMYTVYRTNTNDGSVKKIDGVTAGTYNVYSYGNITEVARFYVDDDDVDTKMVDYTYAVYRQINGEFKKVTPWDISVYSSAATASGGISTSLMALDKDAIYNDVFITITVDDANDSFTLYRAKTVSNDNILDTIEQVKNFEEVKVVSALWGNTSGKYYVMDKNRDDGVYVYKVEFSGTDKKSSEEFDIVTTGTNYVSGPVYYDWLNGQVVVEDTYRKNSETFSDYKYDYKILARNRTVGGTDSDKNLTVNEVKSGKVEMSDNYSYMSLYTSYPYTERGSWSSSLNDYVYYHYYRNDVFEFDSGNGYGSENGYWNGNPYYAGIDANDVYIHGTVNYSLTTSNGLSQVMLCVTKTNTKTGVVSTASKLIYDDGAIWWD